MRFLVSILLAFTAVSCQLEQNYVFNDDFSGNYSLVFDISEIVAMSSEDPEDVEDAFAELNVDSLRMAYENLNGISNVKISSKDNVIRVNYDFANLEALNKSLETENNAAMAFGRENGGDRFSYSKGVFKYDFPSLGDDETLDSLAQMLSIVSYDINMTFAKTIDQSNNGTIQSNGKSLRMEGNLGEVAMKEKSLNLEVTFKK